MYQLHHDQIDVICDEWRHTFIELHGMVLEAFDDNIIRQDEQFHEEMRGDCHSVNEHFRKSKRSKKRQKTSNTTHTQRNPSTPTPSSTMPRSSGRLFMTPESQQDRNYESDDDLDGSFQARPARTYRSDYSPIDPFPTPRPSGRAEMSDPSQTARASSPRIKTEEEQAQATAVNGLRSNEVISIHVGNPIVVHTIPRAHIHKSPILQSWLTENTATSPFVMTPQLLEVDSPIFAKLAQYVITDEYTPKAAAAFGEARVSHMLSGVVASSETYSEELLKAGQLFVLAMQLEAEDLQTHIYTKVTTTEFRKYDDLAMLRFAKIIFGRPVFKDGVQLTGESRDTDDSVVQRKNNAQLMEDWIIERLAKSYWILMGKHSKRFLEVGNQCWKRSLMQKVFRAKADEYDQYHGERVLIED